MNNVKLQSITFAFQFAIRTNQVRTLNGRVVQILIERCNENITTFQGQNFNSSWKYVTKDEDWADDDNSM